MPKISSPTLAEHQIAQRTSLVNAAIDVLAEDGAGSMTPASIGRRAGLARSSVYGYFASSAEILAVTVEELMARTTSIVAEAVGAESSNRNRIHAFVRTMVVLALAKESLALHALDRTDLPAMCLARLDELREVRNAPLRRALTDSGVRDADSVVDFVVAIAETAAGMVAQGIDVDRVITQAIDFVDRGVGVVREQVGNGQSSESDNANHRRP